MKNEATFLDEVRERFRSTMESWQHQYKLSIDEINFLTVSNQWPNQSDDSDTPYIASDRLNSQCKQIVNEQRANRPAVRYHACNSDANAATARVLQGLARHIEDQSKADIAYDTAYEFAVQGGIGFIRLKTDYEVKSFDQRIEIAECPNPFLIYIDPSYRSGDGSDINYAFVLDFIPKDEFEREYPDADAAHYNQGQWLAMASRYPEWFDNDSHAACVCEYFVKEMEPYTLVQLKDGSVKPKDECSKKELRQIKQERQDFKPVVRWYKMCAMELLDEGEWIGDSIPIIPVFGDTLLDNGNRVYSGLVRNNKATQIMLNTVKTVVLKMIAQSPKNPWLVADGTIDDFKDDWASVNVLDLPYLPYKAFGDNAEPLPAPIRNVQEPPIQGMLAVMNTLENDIKSTNALYDPTMGEKMANDQSGVAIKALQQAGSVAHYNYSDNLNRAIRVVGLQLLHLFPLIYNSQRVVRIVGIDDKDKLVTLNGPPLPGTEQNHQKDMNGVAEIYKTDVGIYSVSVGTGPSYATKRVESLNVLTDMAAKNPLVAQYCVGKIVRLMDFPEADDIADMLDKLLPPQLQDQQAQQNPQLQAQQAQQQLQQAHQLIQQLTSTLQKETALANSEQTKLQVARLNASTELTKQQREQQHDAAITTLKAEMEEIKASHQRSHDILSSLHEHIINKDMATHSALLAATIPPTPPVPEQQVGTGQNAGINSPQSS